MADALARRSFLGSLATLPLIGGGVTLLGNPTAAGEPVTRDLLDSYDAWLFHERRFLRFERYGPGDRGAEEVGANGRFAVVDRATGREFDWVAMANAGGRYHATLNDPRASTRAAVVLAAVGCDWREGR